MFTKVYFSICSGKITDDAEHRPKNKKNR